MVSGPVCRRKKGGRNLRNFLEDWTDLMVMRLSVCKPDDRFCPQFMGSYLHMELKKKNYIYIYTYMAFYSDLMGCYSDLMGY